MGPLEILLVVANFLTLVVFTVPRLRAIWWTEYIVLIAVAAAMVQVLAEGARWPMVPAYVLTGVFLVRMATKRVSPSAHIPKRILTSRVVARGAFVLCLIDMGLSVALPTVFPVFHFPHPSGPYQIGTVTYQWVDQSRHELFSTNPKAHTHPLLRLAPLLCWGNSPVIYVPASVVDWRLIAITIRHLRSQPTHMRPEALVPACWLHSAHLVVVSRGVH